MQPTSPAQSTAYNGTLQLTLDLIDDDGFVLLETTPTDTEAPQRTLTEYPNRMLVNRIADKAFALTATGVRLLDGYRYPNRLCQLLGGSTDNIHHCFLHTIERMVNYQGYQLKSNQLTQYLQFLIANTTQKFDVILPALVLRADTGQTPSYYMDLWLMEYQQTKAPKPDFLFIPFIYNGYYFIFPPHIVMIEVNFKEKAIYYYDSQGISIDHTCRNVYEGFNMTLELDKLKEKAFGKNSDAKILCSRYVHQQDTHSCGVYSCDYVERRINGEAFEYIDSNGKNATEIEQTRLAQGLRLSTADPKVLVY